jgi:inosine/xanthosine triphosphatase
MRIVVGSKTQLKCRCCQRGVWEIFKDPQIIGVAVQSGVSSQPMSEKETMDGARQRAYGALESDSTADYGVGLEGGVTELSPTSPNWTGMRGSKGKMFECAWACVVSRDGREGLGGGLYFELPEKVALKIRAGGELGPIMDEMSGENDVKQKMGAIGMFTKGQLDRKSAYIHIVLSALIKFVSPEWFSS